MAAPYSSQGDFRAVSEKLVVVVKKGVSSFKYILLSTRILQCPFNTGPKKIITGR